MESATPSTSTAATGVPSASACHGILLYDNLFVYWLVGWSVGRSVGWLEDRLTYRVSGWWIAVKPLSVSVSSLSCFFARLALSTTLCSVVFPQLCHRPSALSPFHFSVIFPSLCLSWAPCSVIVHLLCYHLLL